MPPKCTYSTCAKVDLHFQLDKYEIKVATVHKYLEERKNTGHFQLFKRIMSVLIRIFDHAHLSGIMEENNLEIIQKFGEILIWESKDLRYIRFNKKMDNLDITMDQDHTAFLIYYIKNAEFFWHLLD